MYASEEIQTARKPLFRIAVPSFRMARTAQDDAAEKRRALTRSELERAFRAELGRERDEARDNCPDLASLRAALYPRAVRAF